PTSVRVRSARADRVGPSACVVSECHVRPGGSPVTSGVLRSPAAPSQRGRDPAPQLLGKWGSPEPCAEAAEHARLEGELPGACGADREVRLDLGEFLGDQLAIEVVVETPKGFETAEGPGWFQSLLPPPRCGAVRTRVAASQGLNDWNA